MVNIFAKPVHNAVRHFSYFDFKYKGGDFLSTDLKLSPCTKWQQNLPGVSTHLRYLQNGTNLLKIALSVAVLWLAHNRKGHIFSSVFTSLYCIACRLFICPQLFVQNILNYSEPVPAVIQRKALPSVPDFFQHNGIMVTPSLLGSKPITDESIVGYELHAGKRTKLHI